MKILLSRMSPSLGAFCMSLAFVLCGSSIEGQCPSADIVENPEEFQWTFHPITAENPEPYYSGVMEVGEETFIMNNGESLTTRAYRQQGGEYNIPGPTIKVIPGNKYILSLHNTLPYEPLNPDHNIFKDPNATNIHTHGLHISGESPGDDVTRVFEGGHGGDFVWDIPAEHMGGTFWYHAHHHGSSFLQVSGGLFGLLIVDDSNDGIPSTVAAMTEREFVLGFLDPGAAGTGGDELLSGSLSSTWTINGLIEGNVCVAPNTWQHWRVLLADRNASMKNIEFGPGCEVMLLARDGVWRTVAPKEILTNTFELTGASRADFAIRVTEDSWLTVDGNNVANIFVDGTEDTSVHPYDVDGTSTWSAHRPEYLRDLRDETDVNTESISMGARTINGSKYDNDVPNLTLPTTQVQEWSLSGAVQHPFHLHIYHVQALEDDGDFEAGEYYDVVSARTSVRFDLNDSTSTPYSGRTIMHCHILSHEDRGAMGWLDVTGGEGPPTFPADNSVGEPYSEYYSLDGGQVGPTAPTSLSASALSSSSIELIWVDNSGDEDGFDIERSLDGVGFSYLTSVGPDVVSYSDAGLTSSTTYYYRVSAYNVGGSSAPTNVASATTESAGGGGFMHVASLTVTRELLNGNRERGVATVTIVDNSGTAVQGATVTGDFSGPTSGSESGVTDIDGHVTLESRAIKNPTGIWCFDVTDISLPGYTYDPSANVLTQACENNAPLTTTESNENPIGKDHHLPKFDRLRVSPNPFGNSTTISFVLHAEMDVRLEVYSTLGQRIDVLASGVHDNGRHYINWTPTGLSNGTYFLIMRAGDRMETRRMILAR